MASTFGYICYHFSVYKQGLLECIKKSESYYSEMEEYWTKYMFCRKERKHLLMQANQSKWDNKPLNDNTTLIYIREKKSKERSTYRISCCVDVIIIIKLIKWSISQNWYERGSNVCLFKKKEMWETNRKCLISFSLVDVYFKSEAKLIKDKKTCMLRVVFIKENWHKRCLAQMWRF